jgi:hypothetical protein
MDDQGTNPASGEMVGIGDLAGYWFTDNESGLNETIWLRPDGSASMDFYNVGLFHQEELRWEIIDGGTNIRFTPTPPGWVENVFPTAIYYDHKGRRVIRLCESHEFYFRPAEQ